MLLSMSNARTRKLRLFCSVSRHSPLATRHFLLAAALLLFSAPCAFSLDPSLDISQYAHTAWKVRDGFVKGQIVAIAQTPDGYLWLGTDSGLYRFDGVRAVPWEPAPGQRLPGSFITQLMVSRDGTLWIGTSKGLASYKNGQLTRYPQIAGPMIASLLENRDGAIWVGQWNDLGQGKLCTIRNGEVKCYGTDGSLGFGALSLFEDSRGTLWIGGSGGFWRWTPGPKQFYSLGDKANTSVLAFAEDSQGGLTLAFGPDGLRRFVSGGAVEHPQWIPKSVRGAVYRLLKDRDAALWIGVFNGGLVHIHEGRTDLFAQLDGLSGNAINALFQDREGNVWVATSEGLDRFRSYIVPTWTVRQGLPFGAGAAVLAASDGSVWTDNGGGLGRLFHSQVTAYRQRPRELSSSVDSLATREIVYHDLPTNFNALFQSHDGRIWASSSRGGLGYFDNQQYHPVGSIGKTSLDALAEDTNGDLWVAARNDGLFRLHAGKVVEKISWESLGRKDHGWRLAVDHASGGLWFAYPNGGIAYLKNGKVRASYSGSDGLGEGVVTHVRWGPRGALWAATESGLSRIRDGHIATLTSKNGLPCDTLHWSMEDDEHFVWLYMACGLARVARSELDAWVNDPNHHVQVSVLDVTDGVRIAARSWGFAPQVSKGPDGKIWFAQQDGIGMIDPRHLPHNSVPPPVHIEQITADGKVFDAANGVSLPRLVRYVDIDYTALSLVVPEKVRFRVKLEGQDKDWRDLVNVRRVSYTNLGPKHYRFLVKACNNSGVWNEEGAALDFVIPPAWYQTNWFRVLCVAAFLVLLWALYQLRLRQLAQQFNMRLEERVGERTRIARDLHDTLLQSFHGVLLFLQSGIHLLPDRPAEAKKTLEGAAEQAERAIIEGREAVQGLRASTVERNDLALAIKTLGGELGAADGNSQRPEFSVQVEGIPRNLHPILRDEVFRITGEAMRNAFRHSDAKQIEVEIRYDERQLRVRVRDDGKGIDPKVLGADGRKGHYGLPGMRERAKLIGGKLTVWSELDSGTEVELSIPASRAYTAPDGQRSWLAEKFAKLAGKDTELKS
jgi:signal transduction histidine kinase/ligand-binding sensor domain-containing protein